MTATSTILAGIFGGWELVLVLVVTAILLGARWLPGLTQRRRSGSPAALAETWKEFIVWVAEGFGVGRIPYAPGTFGSLLGLLWFALLVRTGDPIAFFIGLAIGLACSVAACGAAERITGLKDPGSVVLDEIAAVPICFIPWLMTETLRLKSMPSPDAFFGARTWMLSLLLFGLFRLFDIWKPWPIRPSQNLPGGWGVTIDDVLAAIVVAALSLIAVL